MSKRLLLGYVEKYIWRAIACVACCKNRMRIEKQRYGEILKRNIFSGIFLSYVRIWHSRGIANVRKRIM